MADFSLLLQKLIKNVPPETVVRDFLIEYLKKNYNITIDRKCIQIQKTNLCLSVSPIIKSKLFPHKEQILGDLNAYLKEKDVKLYIKNIM